MKEAITERDYPYSTDESWEPLAFVNSTPDEKYPIRILKAHLKNAEEGHFTGEGWMPDMMNRDQEKRAAFLRRAIRILEEK